MLGIPLTLKEIAASVGGITHSNNIINYITTDSREIVDGDLFIALDGKRNDGENYVYETIKKGAIPMSKSEYRNGITVVDTRAALLLLAEYYANRLENIRQKIAITGSVGKTTTKEFLRVILSKSYLTHASYGNYNNEIGMPLSILSAPANTEMLICELGMNHSGEIRKMANVLRPDIAIITNIGSSHIGNLGSREAIAKAKLEICENMINGVTLVPHSEPLLSSVNNAVTFSTSEADADFYLTNNEDKKITIYNSGKKFLSTDFIFNDAHLLTCLLIAVAAASLSGASAHNIKAGISEISGENIRQNLIRCKNFNFYIDFYNSSAESLFAALSSLNKLNNFPKKSALIGDILELGEFAESIHYEIGRQICKYNLHRLYLFGPLSKHIMKGALKSNFPLERIFINDDVDAPSITVRQIRENSHADEVILMKASRSLKLERILNAFTND